MSEPQRNTEAVCDLLAPILDEAIEQLGAEDRAAITLRFFEGRDLRSVGAALGSSEDAAQKRISRALEKLRELLARRGVTATCASLAAVLSAQTMSAAPAGLAAAVSAAALAGVSTGGGGFAVSALKLMSMAKIKLTVGALVLAGLGTTLVFEHLSLGRVRDQNQALELRAAQLRQSVPSRASQSGSQPQTNSSAQPEAQLRDLGRLRDVVGALRKESNVLAALQVENRELRTATGESADPVEAEFQKQTEMRASHLKQWGLSFILYAQAHDNQYPESFEQAANVQDSASLLEFDTNHFEIVYRGTTESVADPGKTIVFREKQARRSPKGEWVQVYGFADGHVEAHTELDEAAFAAWEQGRIVADPPAADSKLTQPRQP